MTKYPLTWPTGWRRTPAHQRRGARFTKRTYVPSEGGGYHRTGEVTVSEGTTRILASLQKMGIGADAIVISTNLELRLDGLPRSGQREPADPGVAVYWKKRKDAQHKVMAIDQYDRIADNLAAIAATLEAMRAIERHGGAVILERAFTGFTALPMPNSWRSVLGYPDESTPTLQHVKDTYRLLAKGNHPDVGGIEARMKELNWAMAEAEKELAA